MQTQRPLWNLPVALGAIGAVLVAAGVLFTVPTLNDPPSSVDVGDKNAKPFPSFPEEVPSLTKGAPSVATAFTQPPQPAPTAIGGGPPTSSTMPPAMSTTGVSSTEGPGGLPLVGANAGSTSMGDGGATTTTEGGAAPQYVPGIVPLYGAPPASTPSGGPVVNGAATNSPPLWGGPSGSSVGSGTNAAVVNPRPSIAASMLVPMASGDAPDSSWTGFSAFLRAGDVVMAHGDDESAAAIFLGWSERAMTDRPLVSYGVSVRDAAQLRALLSRGLPATLGAVGISSLDGLDDATLTALASAVHASGKRFYIATTSAPATVSLPVIGARADIVELVVNGSTIQTAAAEANVAASLLRTSGHPLLFVRVPIGLMTTSQRTVEASGAIATTVQGAGFAMPPGTLGMMGDLRVNP